MKHFGKCLIAGSLAGVLNGMFGAGGGLVLVPLFAGWLALEEKQAFATSVAVILPLSIVSSIIVWIQGNQVFAEALPYLLGGIVGGTMSTPLLKHLKIEWLHRMFAVLILYGGVKAVFWP